MKQILLIHNISGVARYQGLENKHFKVKSMGAITSDKPDDGIYLRCRTLQSHLEVAMAATTRIYAKNQQIGNSTIQSQKEIISQHFEFQVLRNFTENSSVMFSYFFILFKKSKTFFWSMKVKLLTIL